MSSLDLVKRRLSTTLPDLPIRFSNVAGSLGWIKRRLSLSAQMAA